MKNSEIDLGLELLRMRQIPGEPLTQHDIAAWCGCSRGYIFMVEQAAVRRVREHIRKDFNLTHLEITGSGYETI